MAEPTPIKDSLTRHAAEVKGVAPSKFIVGGVYDYGNKTATGGVSYNRSWKNGWGATAYAKAWWRDASVTPVNEPQIGGTVGGQVEYDFNKK